MKRKIKLFLIWLEFRIKYLLCLIYHKWEIHQLVDEQGNCITFTRTCSRCHRTQSLSKPEKYDPIKFIWKSIYKEL